MSIKMNVGISAAVITAAGGIAAALIGGYNHPAAAHSIVTPTPSSPTPGIGVIHVSTDSVAAYVYGTPVSDGTSDRVGELSGGQQVEIVCTVQGPTMMGTDGTSSVWDKIKYNQSYGYVSDTEVDTASDQPQAPSC